MEMGVVASGGDKDFQFEDKVFLDGFSCATSLFSALEASIIEASSKVLW